MNLKTASPLQLEIYAVCLEVEKLPASEFQTRLSSALSDASRGLEDLAVALVAARVAINPPDRGGINMHEWGQRLKSATVVIDLALSKASASAGSLSDSDS
jgi:hypothetical protein